MRVNAGKSLHQYRYPLEVANPLVPTHWHHMFYGRRLGTVSSSDFPEERNRCSIPSSTNGVCLLSADESGDFINDSATVSTGPLPGVWLFAEEFSSNDGLAHSAASGQPAPAPAFVVLRGLTTILRMRKLSKALNARMRASASAERSKRSTGVITACMTQMVVERLFFRTTLPVNPGLKVTVVRKVVLDPRHYRWKVVVVNVLAKHIKHP